MLRLFVSWNPKQWRRSANIPVLTFCWVHFFLEKPRWLLMFWEMYECVALLCLRGYAVRCKIRYLVLMQLYKFSFLIFDFSFLPILANLLINSRSSTRAFRIFYLTISFVKSRGCGILLILYYWTTLLFGNCLMASKLSSSAPYEYHHTL